MKHLKHMTMVAGLLTIGSCGGDGERGSDVDYSKPSTTFAPLIPVFCERAIECKDSAPDGALTFDDEADCRAALQGLLGTHLVEQDASVAAGRITWNADDARYCTELMLGVLSEATCAEFWDDGLDAGDDDPRCESLGEGTVANGGACTIDDDCADEAAECTDDVCTVEDPT